MKSNRLAMPRAPNPSMLAANPRVALLEAGFQVVREAVVVACRSGIILYVNRAAELLTGRPARWAMGRQLKELLEIGDIHSPVDPLSPQEQFQEGVLRRHEGPPVDIEYRVFPLSGNAELDDGYIVVARDISQRHQRERVLQTTELSLRENAEALFAERERAQVTLDSIGDAVISTDFSGRVTYLNQAAERLTGWSPAEGAGKPVASVCKFFENGTNRSIDCPTTEAIIQNVRQSIDGSCVLKRRCGSLLAVEVSATPIHDRGGGVVGAVLVLHDVTTARQLAEKLAHLAMYDHLTGLPNRALFNERLEQAILDASQSGTALSVLYIDLDRFKHINDTRGHMVGDEVLRAAAQRMRACVRDADTLGRYGGDEFLALLVKCNWDEAQQRARWIVEELSKPLTVGTSTLYVTASVGIAQYPHHASDAWSLIQTADTAMYDAKQKNRTGLAGNI